MGLQGGMHVRKASRNVPSRRWVLQSSAALLSSSFVAKATSAFAQKLVGTPTTYRSAWLGGRVNPSLCSCPALLVGPRAGEDDGLAGLRKAVFWCFTERGLRCYSLCTTAVGEAAPALSRVAWPHGRSDHATLRTNPIVPRKAKERDCSRVSAAYWSRTCALVGSIVTARREEWAGELSDKGGHHVQASPAEKKERTMDFTMSTNQREWLDRVQSFMTKHVRPAVPVYKQQGAEGDRWKMIPVLEDLKKKARAEGLWNMFLPPSSHEDDEFRGAGLSNLEYAALAEEMGHIGWASEVFNCAAPDTGNMEVLIRYGTKEQKKQWLKPLLNGEIRSAFLMTEPAVASSDATNIETRIERDGDHYVINGRKWWSSGVGHPRCKIAIVMGKTDPKASRYQQQSQILVPLDTGGIQIEKMLPVFGFDDAPHGHGQVFMQNVRVPASNLLLGEGRGFEIAQGRLGPGRIHHCMRTIGRAEEALEKMVKRLNSRVAFGKKIIEHSLWEQRIAEARIDIEMSRLLCFKAADMMDKIGNKGAQLEIAMIKVAAPRMALKIIDHAIQAFGGAGVSDEAGLARDYASIRTMRLADGPDEVHCRAITRLELRKHANAQVK